ncbi:uncharacterized protein LOC134834961 [Culicoides brevitarsis]|uniref:uncharacterized protein LOC134834961 n=1 Tax=Culicoides brevitarsis TaxID=469753 RepID=UPI00307C947A
MTEIITQDTPMLTIDALIHLFQYLEDFDDLKNCSLVCKQYLQATQEPKILKRFKLCFNFVSIGSDEDSCLSLFAKSDRLFSNIYFENAKFVKIDPDFWSRWSESITELTFDYKFRTPDLPGGNFLKLLLYTPKLKTLSIICSLHLCNDFMKKLTEEERKTVFAHLKGVQELNLYFSEVCVDTLEFEPWLDEMPNLKNIDFDFYSKRAPIPPAAYEKIFYFLERYGSKVKGLHICDHARPVNKTVVQRLLAIKDLKLKAFDHIINKATSKEFTDFLCTQSELQYLTVNGSFSVSRSFKHMPKLKEIAIVNGPAFDGFAEFNNVPKLQSLGIGGFEFYDEEGLKEDIQRRKRLAEGTKRRRKCNENQLKNSEEEEFDYKLKPNPNLKELSLIDACVSFEIPLVQRLCECFPNLRLLNLDAAIIDDEALPFIFQLKKLEELKLSNTQISDAGILGIKSSKSLKKRKSIDEEEISSTKNLSINALTELEVLCIDFCKKITEKSYLALEFKKLKHLSVQGNHMTAQIFKSLGKKCPTIESINLSKSNSMREQETEALAKSISGLETLELQSCVNFNKRCLMILMENCRKLETLDVTKCDCDVKSVAQKMFLEIKSLRRIMLDKERLYRCNYIQND